MVLKNMRIKETADMAYTNYRLKLQQKLKYFKIPDSEYSFDDEGRDNYVCVKNDGAVWSVCEIHNGAQSIRGVFYSEYSAYDFLFYLVMKKYVSIERRWW